MCTFKCFIDKKIGLLFEGFNLKKGICFGFKSIYIKNVYMLLMICELMSCCCYIQKLNWASIVRRFVN